MRVVIYIRVSSDEQVQDGYSLAAQEYACREYAKKQCWQVGEVYIEEGRSGRTTERPQLQRLLKDAHTKPRPFKAVIFHNLDRLMRNLRLQLNLKAELDAAGVQLVSVLDHIDTTTPEGIMHFQMKGMLAEWYSNNMGREIRKGYGEKARQGWWIGPVPTGYQLTEDGLVPSTDADAIRECFTLYASGLYSFFSLAQELNSRGHRIVTQAGERSVWGKENVRTVLKNPAYRGRVRFKDQEFAGKHVPLVSDELWFACQDLMGKRGAKTGRVSFGDGLRGGMLTELAFCPVCKGRLWYHWSGGSYSGGHGGKYYVCSGRSKMVCDAGFIRAVAIEGDVLDILQGLAIPPEIRGAIIARAEERLSQQSQPASSVNYAEIEAQIKRLDQLYIKGRLDESTYEAERERLEAQLAAAPAPVAAQTLDYRAAFDRLASVKTLVEGAELGQQRALLRTIFDRIWIERQAVVAITPSPLYLPLVATARAVLNMVGREGFEPSTS